MTSTLNPFDLNHHLPDPTTELAHRILEIQNLKRLLASTKFRVGELERENAQLKTKLELQDMLSVAVPGGAVSLPLDGPEGILASQGDFVPAYSDGGPFAS